MWASSLLLNRRSHPRTVVPLTSVAITRVLRGVEFWRGGVEIDRASALEIMKEDVTDEWEFL